QDIDDILALMDKKGKTAFERYLTSAPLPSRNALLDLRGTISFRKNDLTAAVAAFSKVDKGFWEKKYEFNYYLDSDPFILATDSLHRGEFPASKTAFVQRMIDLENEAKANPAKAAENYWLLGTAWFNCSYFGKSWMMYCYGQSVGEVAVEDWYQSSYYFQPVSEADKKLYYQCQRAFEYLDKAKAATNDREMLAKVEYLKARHRSWSYELTPEEQAKLDEIEWDNRQAFFTKKEMSYFKDWANAYKSTSYYDELTATCPILVTYFGK
nr:hypothetical protein [Saprospiraceae bacterium]